MAPQHSLAFIRPIQRDGADDNDSSCLPSIPPPCHSLLSCSPSSFGRALTFFLFFFVPAFLSVTPLRDRNACRLLRGLRIGWGIEGNDPPFLFLRHFLACPWFCFPGSWDFFFFFSSLPAHCAFFKSFVHAAWLAPF